MLRKTEDTEVDAIGRTSLIVAGLRAAEHRRPDRLFEDPFAELFVVEAGGDEPGSRYGDFVAIMAEQVAVRTRFFDDALLGAAAAGCQHRGHAASSWLIAATCA